MTGRPTAAEFGRALLEWVSERLRERWFPTTVGCIAGILVAAGIIKMIFATDNRIPVGDGGFLLLIGMGVLGALIGTRCLPSGGRGVTIETGLPHEWRAIPVDREGGVEARRLASDDHPFGGISLQGTADQCSAAAWMIEVEGANYGIEPLRRRPRRGDG